MIEKLGKTHCSQLVYGVAHSVQLHMCMMRTYSRYMKHCKTLQKFTSIHLAMQLQLSASVSSFSDFPWSEASQGRMKRNDRNIFIYICSTRYFLILNAKILSGLFSTFKRLFIWLFTSTSILACQCGGSDFILSQSVYANCTIASWCFTILILRFPFK